MVHETSEGCFGQFRACPAKGAGVVGTRLSSQRHEQDNQPSHRGRAGPLFFFEEDLREECPERDRRSIDRVVFLAEDGAFFVEDGLDGFFGQDVGEGQAGLLQKRGEDEVEPLWRGIDGRG